MRARRAHGSSFSTTELERRCDERLQYISPVDERGRSQADLPCTPFHSEKVDPGDHDLSFMVGVLDCKMKVKSNKMVSVVDHNMDVKSNNMVGVVDYTASVRSNKMVGVTD